MNEYIAQKMTAPISFDQPSHHQMPAPSVTKQEKKKKKKSGKKSKKQHEEK